MKTCKCGETDPSQFYHTGHWTCKSCVAEYNVEYHRKKRKRAKEKRKKCNKKPTLCPEVGYMEVSSPLCLLWFCQGRRKIRFWKQDQATNCRDCGLHGMIDAGFIPVNFSIKSFAC